MIAVEDSGGDGPAIVFVHGLSSNLRIWDPVVARLRHQFRCVAYDQRNHGKSFDDPDVSFEALTADLASLGLERPTVVGHSWGASVALEYAISGNACAGLICVDGATVALAAAGWTWEQCAAALRPPDMEMRLADVDARWAMSDERKAVFLRSFPAGKDGIMRRVRPPLDVHMRIVRTIWDEALLDQWAKVQVPALVVLADEPSMWTEAKRSAAAHLPAPLVWLESGHDIPLDRPDELATLIAEFIGAHVNS